MQHAFTRRTHSSGKELETPFTPSSQAFLSRKARKLYALRTYFAHRCCGRNNQRDKIQDSSSTSSVLLQRIVNSHTFGFGELSTHSFWGFLLIHEAKLVRKKLQAQLRLSQNPTAAPEFEKHRRSRSSCRRTPCLLQASPFLSTHQRRGP